jgi:hypothetical protein
MRLIATDENERAGTILDLNDRERRNQMENQKKPKPSRKDRAVIRKQLEWVAEQLDFIEAAGLDDRNREQTQRVVLSLPRSILYLLRFLAIMEQNAPPSSKRKIDAIMRRYLEDQIFKQSYAKLNRMYSYMEN